jgi:N utilization substance protein A
MEVVVEDKQLSLAIGKKGQNVRLAAKLTGWRIDIKSEEEKRREVEAEFGALGGGEGEPAAAEEGAVETSEAAAAGEEAAVAGDVVAGETIADDEAAPTGDAKTDQT